MKTKDIVISFETAKLAKNRGYHRLAKYFYNKDKRIESVLLNTDASHLVLNGEQIIDYFEGYYDWNSVDQDDEFSMVDGFNSSDGAFYYPIASAINRNELRKWIREEHHINIEILFTTEGTYIYKIIEKEYTKISCNGITYKTYEEALEDALYEILNELI